MIIFILGCLTGNAQEEPEYFRLLEAERPNIIEIRNAYLKYYETHEWKKDRYFRAYRDFIRAYPLSSFDEHRDDCYYTGQNGVISAIALHPTNSNIIFAGGLAGGIWRSRDKGRNWSTSLVTNIPRFCRRWI